MEIGRIVEIDVGATLFGGERIAASAPEVSHALFVRDEQPVALVPAEELGTRLTAHVVEVLETRYGLSVETVPLDPEDEVQVPVDRARDVAVISHAGAHYVLKGLAAGGMRTSSIAYFADPRLPNPDPGRSPGPPVTFRCENGHRVRQPASSPNLSCPVCRRPLKRT